MSLIACFSYQGFFFTLEVKKVKAKYARNPRTNEKIYISEKKKIKFKFSKVWSEKINEKI